MEFLALVLAFVGIFWARKASFKANELGAKIATLETTLEDLKRSRPAQAASGAAAPQTSSAEIPIAPPIVPAAADTPRTAEPFSVDDVIKEAATSASQSTAAPTPPAQDTAPDAPKPGLEERLGTRWVVWVGGLTLALGGLFLVRYSIEQGLLGPGVRVLLASLFAAGLLAAGEWTRRKETATATGPLPIANIPAILTAAGTVVAFGTVYASYALYSFLAPASAFILLGIVAMCTLAAALLHGPALAGLGIAAAFVTPILVSSDKPDFWALYIYLAIVTGAAFALARARLWRWLAITTVVFAVLWTLPCLSCGPSMVAPHVFHVIAGFILAALLVVCGFMFGPPAEGGKIEPISSTSLGAYLFGALLVVLSSIHADTAMIAFALLVAAALYVAWRAEAATGVVASAAVFTAVVFIEWAVRANPQYLVVPGGSFPGVAPGATDGSVSLHLITAAGFGLAFGVTGFLAQGRSSSTKIPVVWAASAVFVPLALLVALYARIAHLDRSIPFALIAIAVAGGFALATEWLTRREQCPGQAIATALFATGTLSALSLGLTFALEKGWLTIALALMSLATAWISMKRPIPFLRWLAAILAAIVTLRIGYDPRIAGANVGTTPIFNWLLWGYGVPALAFWAGAWFLKKRADDAPLRMVEAAAILFTVLLAFTEIRHYANGGNIYRVNLTLVEVALQICVGLAMAIGLERLRVRSQSIVHNVAAVVLTVLALLGVVFGLFIIENPVFWYIEIRGLFWNELLLGYALPAVLALLLSYAVAGQRSPTYANTIASFALMLALAYVSLEVRRFFHGSNLTTGGTSDAEQYTYSIAWLGFGVILLGVGLVFSSQRARLASAIIIALTVLKVFVIDMSNLTGIYRALSFMGLGLVLIAIGWFYQRILFRQRATSAPAAPAAG
ncbi:MAG: DUF2339 domain-containing protein [Pseudomonadota bacterium]